MFTGIVPMQRFLKFWSVLPTRIFGIPSGGDPVISDSIFLGWSNPHVTPYHIRALFPYFFGGNSSLSGLAKKRLAARGQSSLARKIVSPYFAESIRSERKGVIDRE